MDIDNPLEENLELFNLDEGVFLDYSMPRVLSVPDFYSCENCGSGNWAPSESRGDIICFGCGYCVRCVTLSGPDRAPILSGELPEGYVGSLVVSAPEDTQMSRAYCSKYKRQVYWRAKLRQWMLQDRHGINESDWRIIKQVFERTYERKSANPSHARSDLKKGYPVLRKEDICSILQDCDVQGRPLKTGIPKQKFVSLYLERWLFLRWKLTGLGTVGTSVPQVLLEFLIDSLDELDAAFPQAIGSIFTRQAFPHFDSVVEKLLALRGASEFDKDCVKLNTKRARKKFELCWWAFCKYLKWPYLSKEPEILTRRIKVKYGL